MTTSLSCRLTTSSKCFLILVYIWKKNYWHGRKLTGTGIVPRKRSRMLSGTKMVTSISQIELLMRSVILGRQVLFKNTQIISIDSMSMPEWRTINLSTFSWMVSPFASARPWQTTRTSILTHPSGMRNCFRWTSLGLSSRKRNEITKARVRGGSVV